MRFKLGMAVGFAAGYWAATTSSEDRRAKLDEGMTGVRGNPRVQRITETVSKDARRLGDAVEQRFMKAADGAVGTVTDTVESSGTSASGTSTSSPSGTSSTGSTTQSQTRSA